MSTEDLESNAINPEEEFTPEFLDTTQRIHDYFLEYGDEYLVLPPQNPEEPNLFSIDMPLRQKRFFDEKQQQYIRLKVTEAIKSKGLELVSIDFSSDEVIMILVRNPEPTELETEEMEVQAPVEVYENPEEITKKERAAAEFRSKGKILFTGHCAYCSNDYEIEDIYFGKKPKVKKGKKTFDLDYGKISCTTPGCASESKKEDPNVVSIYEGKQHEVTLYYRHKAKSETEAKQWIDENIEPIMPS